MWVGKYEVKASHCVDRTRRMLEHQHSEVQYGIGDGQDRNALIMILTKTQELANIFNAFVDTLTWGSHVYILAQSISESRRKFSYI